VSTRRRALIAFVLGLAVALFGLLQRRGDVLGLSLPLFLFAATLILSDAMLKSPQLRVSRAFSASRIHEDEQTDVALSVTNVGRTDSLLSLQDDIPPHVNVVEGNTRLAGRLQPGRTETCTYTLAAPRGRHEQRGLSGTYWAPWGLAVREASLQLETRLSSLPVFESLRDISIRPRRTHAYAGSVRTRRSGSGLEILGCREYSLGDDIRRINWRASARQNDLIINLFEQEQMTDVNIIVDARAHMHLQIEGVRTFDLVVRAAASMASYFLRQSNRVGLMIYGDALNWTFPAAGRLQMERLLHALAAAQPSTRLAFGKLKHIPTRLFATGSQLVIFSTLGSREDAEVPSQLVARGYSVMLVYPDTTELERSAFPSGRNGALAERIIRLDRNTTLSHLARVGVDVVDWRITEPLSVAFHHARAASVRRGRP